MSLGKRAENKSLFMVTAIFVLAVIGAYMSKPGYRFGQEGITGAAIGSSNASLALGTVGVILTIVSLIALGVIGIAALAKKPQKNYSSKLDRDIASISQQLRDIDSQLKG
ncbi:MAG: hypothetical protein ACE5DM_02955 [Candidatus Nanoarchaeia archaeon]